ncbi:MAG TPA: two-component regulator propeller domain-containing protein [Luteibaculaceae bacterium]|nr:two-component regulator propeller domain-containing protein [Luteibaculaceae bacterium]
MMKKHYLLACLLAGWTFQLIAQPLSLGQWRDHVSFQDTRLFCRAENGLFVANKLSLLFIDEEDQSITPYSKTNALSDVNISALGTSSSKQVIIGYLNGNIDVLNKDGSVRNIPDLRRANIIGDKSIKGIYCVGNKAYVCCGFGILLIDLIKFEVLETFRIGPNGSNTLVYDLTLHRDTLYAATEIGLLKAPANSPLLSFFETWKADLSIPNPNRRVTFVESGSNEIVIANEVNSNRESVIARQTPLGWENSTGVPRTEVFSLIFDNNKFFVAGAFSGYEFDFKGSSLLPISGNFGPGQLLLPRAFIKFNNRYWIADNTRGLVSTTDGSSFINENPNGPLTNNAYKIFTQGNYLYVATGAVNSAYNNQYRQDGITWFDGTAWKSTDENSDTTLKRASDFLWITPSPSNPELFYVASWDRGLIEINNGRVSNIFDESNSAIQEVPGFNDNYRIASSVYDSVGNHWVANSFAPNSLVLRRPNGEWTSIAMNADFGSPSITAISHILVGRNGFKWMIRHRSGLYVYDDGGTLTNPADDRKKALGTTVNEGGLPSNEVFCMAEDLDGEIWIGSNKGFAILFGSESVFDTKSINFNQPIIEQDGNFEKILETETINAIAVDGANRKWMATAASGVFLISEDGTSQIAHFTAENSPLFSNEVNSLAINQETGEVFFATSMGIQSYMGDAIASAKEINAVNVFPNPVRPGYSGPIVIRGIQRGVKVAIADIAGNIVTTLNAQGGEAIWNGLSANNQRLNGGVYLILATNPDGSQTGVGKILLMNGE